MLETSGRLLRLLALLQARRDWPGPDLAARLGVSPRTLRRDMGKLRSLGYPVDAVPGTGGGYRLGAGAALPPLLLDDDEAVAVAVAAAARDRLRIRFGYTSHDGAQGSRAAEPHHLVHAGRRWYLLAWDPARAGWRTFRADRIASPQITGPRFTPREAPGGDPAAYVSRSISSAPYRYQARIRLRLPAQAAAERLPPTVGQLQLAEHILALAGRLTRAARH